MGMMRGFSDAGWWVVALLMVVGAQACNDVYQRRRGDPECACGQLDETRVGVPPNTGVAGRVVGIVDGPCTGGCRSVAGGGDISFVLVDLPGFQSDAGRAGTSQGGYYGADLLPSHSYLVYARIPGPPSL